MISPRSVAGWVGLTGIACGAFASHMLKGRLDELQTTAFWQTGTWYHLVHAVALLVLSGWQPFPRLAFWLMVLGVVLFSGSLYCFALTHFTAFVFATPCGGFALLGSWFVLAADRSANGKEKDPPRF